MNDDVLQDSNVHTSTLRTFAHPELRGTSARKCITKFTTDLPATLREVTAYTRLTQDWIKVYAATLQRIQQPKNIDVRRLDIVTGQLTSLLKTFAHHATKSKGKTDVHTDAEYHRTTGKDDEVKSYGL